MFYFKLTYPYTLHDKILAHPVNIVKEIALRKLFHVHKIHKITDVYYIYGLMYKLIRGFVAMA